MVLRVLLWKEMNDKATSFRARKKDGGLKSNCNYYSLMLCNKSWISKYGRRRIDYSGKNKKLPIKLNTLQNLYLGKREKVTRGDGIGTRKSILDFGQALW